MDTQIMSAFEVLARTMREAGYRESTIEQSRRAHRCLSRFTDDGSYTPEAGRRYVAARWDDGRPHSQAHMKKKRKLVLQLERFFETGVFDLTPLPSHPPKTTPSAPGLSSLLASYVQHCEEAGLAQTTRRSYADMARLFLLFAESSGLVDEAQVEPAHVLEFMSHMRSLRSGTDPCYIACPLRQFLKFLHRDDLVDSLRLVPAGRKHAIVEVLGDEDEEALVDACCNRLVSAKDAAITLLALTTGLRAGDIVELRLRDICWRSMSLHIIQRKTSNYVVLPLQPAVADALGEYVLEERPGIDDDHVFLTSRAPYSPLSGSASVYQATQRALASAGLDGGGTRLLRHNAATKMLRSGAELPVISAVMGHADPNSTGIYMELDSERMRLCVLALPGEVAS